MENLKATTRAYRWRDAKGTLVTRILGRASRSGTPTTTLRGEFTDSDLRRLKIIPIVYHEATTLTPNLDGIRARLRSRRGG